MRLIDNLLPRTAEPSSDQSRFLGLEWMLYNGNQYPIGVMQGSRAEEPDPTFRSYVDNIHRRSGPVAAAVSARAYLMSQIRFAWRYGWTNPDAGALHSSRALTPIERPAGSTRPGLLFQLEQDASYAGSGYAVRRGNTIRRLAPDHVTFLLGSNEDPRWTSDDMPSVPWDLQVLALIYRPDPANNRNIEAFMPGEFAVWAPEPDPVYFWRGQSWVTSVVREVVADSQATDHQRKFFENAATPNLVFVMDPSKTAEQVQQYADVVNSRHTGAMNAYKNMYLGGGTDVKVVGSSLESLNLKDLTGGLENRVAIRSRVPAVILGTREGLSGSSLNAGNYNAARRMLADGWFAPHAESLCASLEAIVPPPAGSELWYRRDEILFLQEDQKDAADISAAQAQTYRQLVDGGAEPDSVTDFLATGDVKKIRHTGKLSVQLQPPGEGDEDPDAMSEGDDDDVD